MSSKSDPKIQKKNLELNIEETNQLLKKYTSLKQAMMRGFLSGLAGFIGGLVGATLIITGLFWFLSQLEVIPIIGGFASDILYFIQNNTDIKLN